MTNWIRKHPHSISYVLVVAVAAISVFGIKTETERRIEGDARQETNAREQICAEVQDLQNIVSDMITVIVNPSGSVSNVSMTQLPTFQDLSPETQAFLRELSAALASGGSSAVIDRLEQFQKDRLGVPACTEPEQ